MWKVCEKAGKIKRSKKSGHCENLKLLRNLIWRRKMGNFGICGQSEKSKKWVQLSGMWWKCKDCVAQKLTQHISFPWRWLSRVSKPTKLFQLSQIAQIDHKLSQMITNCPRWSQIVSGDHKLCRMIANCPRWSQILPDDHRLSQVITNYTRWSQRISWQTWWRTCGASASPV